MLLWSESPHKVLRVAAGTQFRFLSQESSLAYIVILIELFRHRQDQEHEVPFDRLLDAARESYDRFGLGEPPDGARLRDHLDALREWGNVERRLEPRRIIRIKDRGLERYLFRLADDTAAILLHLENRLSEHREGGLRSARFSLREVEEALALVVSLAGPVACADETSADAAARAGSAILRAYRSVAEAGEELLLLDLKLSEATTRTPDPEGMEALTRQIETYLERYLEDVEAIRRSSWERLMQLLHRDRAGFLERVRNALDDEFRSAPMRPSAPPPDPHEVLLRIRAFLEDAGTLDRRRTAVHQRLADVVGHMQRHVRALVRRSQVRESLRGASRALLSKGDLGAPADIVDELFMVSLWSSAHIVPDGCSGTADARASMPRPRRAGRPASDRFAGAVVHPTRRAVGTEGRALLELRMQALNEFVHSRVLRGRPTALVSDAELDDFADLRQLLAAVREGLLGPSPIRRRYLNFSVARSGREEVILVPRSHEGVLRTVDLRFSEVAR